QPSSITKKMKDKAFARAVSRDDIQYGAVLLNLPLADHIANCIAALQSIADQLELAPPSPT
ncbi:MAG: HAD family hydrolase, partial [Planctomycetota bacterium]